MSQVRNEAANVRPNAEFAMGTVSYSALCSPSSPTTPIGDDQYDTPQWAQSRASQPEGHSDFVDGSGPIFSMYLEMAEEEDKKMAESWKADAEGTLVFVHLSLLVL